MIFPEGKTALFVRSKYLVCVAHQLHRAIKRGEVFVSHSNRHNDPRARLLEGEAWEAVKHDVHRALNLPFKPAELIERLGKSLDGTYKTVVKNLPNNPALTFKKIKGVLTPALAEFEALPEPETLTERHVTHAGHDASKSNRAFQKSTSPNCSSKSMLAPGSLERCCFIVPR